MNKLKVVGIDAKGYGKVYKAVMRNPAIPLTAKALYAYFCSYAGSGTTAFPGREKIIRDLQITKNTFTKYLNYLVDAQYIARTRTPMGNIYEILLTVPDKDGKLVEAKSMGYGTVPKLAMLDEKLSANAKGIYAYLCSYAGSSKVAYPRRGTILRELDIGKDAYYRHYSMLVEFGYITPEQTTGDRGRYNVSTYTLNDILYVAPENGTAEASRRAVSGKSADKGAQTMKKTKTPPAGPPARQAATTKELAADGPSGRRKPHDEAGQSPHSKVIKAEVKDLVQYDYMLSECKAWASLKNMLGHYDTSSGEDDYYALCRSVVDELVSQISQFLGSHSKYVEYSGRQYLQVEATAGLKERLADADRLLDIVFHITENPTKVRTLRGYLKQTVLNLAVQSDGFHERSDWLAGEHSPE